MSTLQPPPFSDEIKNMFKRYFKTDIIKFTDITLWGLGIYSFDIIRFDDYCQKRLGYVEDSRMSLKMFLEKTYDQEALKLISQLISISTVDEIINLQIDDNNIKD